MATWIRRREKVQAHTGYIKWRQHNLTLRTSTPIEYLDAPRLLKVTLHPTVRAVSYEELSEKYGAVDFQDCLADFIAQLNHPGASAAALHSRAADTLLPFRRVPAFHRIKFVSRSSSDDFEVVNGVVVRPEQNDARGRTMPARFDTVLVRGRHGDIMHGNHGKSQ